MNIEEIEKSINYKFKNKELLKEIRERIEYRVINYFSRKYMEG